MHTLISVKAKACLKCLVAGVVVASVLQLTGAQAQSLHYNDMKKVSPAVLEKAKQGVSQDLVIVLERREIEEREAVKRRARGLKFNDSKLSAEMVKEIDDLKANVFPDGRMGEARVIETFSQFPIVIVRVPNLKALAQILAHPKVEAVQGNRVFRPALQQSLPLAEQASASSEVAAPLP